MSLMPVIAFVHHHTLLIPYAHDSSLPIYSLNIIPAAEWLPQFYAMSLRPPCFQFSDLNRIQLKNQRSIPALYCLLEALWGWSCIVCHITGIKLILPPLNRKFSNYQGVNITRG